jgi:nuclear migration protein JNM1
LQSDLAALETELSDPSNPLLAKEREEDNVDPGELIRGLVDVKARLGKISKGKEGRGKLVSVVLGETASSGPNCREHASAKDKRFDDKDDERTKDAARPPDIRSIAEMDKRVGQLETLIGSSSTALDEVPQVALSAFSVLTS